MWVLIKFTGPGTWYELRRFPRLCMFDGTVSSTAKTRSGIHVGPILTRMLQRAEGSSSTGLKGNPKDRITPHSYMTRFTIFHAGQAKFGQVNFHLFSPTPRSCRAAAQERVFVRECREWKLCTEECALSSSDSSSSRR